MEHITLEQFWRILLWYSIICWALYPFVMLADTALGIDKLRAPDIEFFLAQWVLFPCGIIYFILYMTPLLIGFILKIIITPLYKLYNYVGRDK